MFSYYICGEYHESFSGKSVMLTQCVNVDFELGVCSANDNNNFGFKFKDFNFLIS